VKHENDGVADYRLYFAPKHNTREQTKQKQKHDEQNEAQIAST
jgi:hypothetical protein